MKVVARTNLFMLTSLMLAPHVSSASAATILADDFEGAGNTPGNAPSNWTAANTGVVATHTVNTAAQSPFSGAGSQGVYGLDERNSVTTSIARSFPSPQTDGLTISFDFRFTSLRISASNNNSDYVFQLLDSVGAVSLQLFLSDNVSGTSAAVTVLTPGTPANVRQSLATISRDTWYRVTIQTDATGVGSSNLTADIALAAYVSGSEADGNLVTSPVASVSDIPLVADIHDYAGVRFSAATDATADNPLYLGGKHLDNLTITSVPEPSAALGVALGVLTLMRTRH